MTESWELAEERISFLRTEINRLKHRIQVAENFKREATDLLNKYERELEHLIKNS
jgi:uncharacterized small protein (DUF1192 family)